MPAQQTLAVIAYFVALGLPSRWKQFLHLMLVSPALTVQGVYMLGAIRGNNLTVSLHSYRTGASCLDLWHSKPNLKVPGAGDILGFYSGSHEWDFWGSVGSHVLNWMRIPEGKFNPTTNSRTNYVIQQPMSDY
ncbi:hypothetical protein B2J93_4990 [Marssonina coronariae]|uniref:Uncharacterized protein n=1 Tax=Diplocarpon coronariae TaxID=2795749 RepID=A0A218ZHA0_9HELO|nr:hypothetical protein B2J93_4990 [Marssonina coronariae]